jgi:hypothetical protein
VLAVRWYLPYGLSYRDVEELLVEGGVHVDHVTIYRWVQRLTPLLTRLGTSRTKNTEIPRSVTVGVHVEEVAGQHGRLLGVRELPPSRVGVPDRSRRYPLLVQDAADAGRCHVVAKFEQLALDSFVSPAGILPGQALDRLGHGGGGGQASEAMWIGHFLATR